MKRILRAGILGTAVSMLFTGCGSGSLVSGAVDGYKEIEWQVKETQENLEKLGESGLREGETMAAKEMPDYYEENEENKFEDLEGTAAFKIKDGHSDNTKDIEAFNIGALKSDGTFLYSYVTKAGERPAEGTADNRQIVHCMAAYNYKTGQFRVIHENVFTRSETPTGEDEEAFFMQMCSSDGSGDMFVYDCGAGYLYGADGNLKFATDIENFVRKHFKGYSIVTTEALTDGGNRIYVDLAIEKEEISVPDEELGDEGSEEDADKEAEELDKEMDNKTIETVLVYDFKEYDSSIDQTNLKLDAQIAKWQQMRNIEAGYLAWTPPAEADWQNAVSQVPSEWGPAYLYGLRHWSEIELNIFGITDSYMGGTPVFKWNGEKEFGYEANGYTSNFIPKYGSYSPFTDLQAETELSNVFIFLDGRYYELYGKTGNDLGEGDYSEVSFSRTVKRVDVVTHEPVPPETESTTEQVISYIPQSLTKYRKRDTYPTNSYLEGYWTLDEGQINSVFDVVDGDVFCLHSTTGFDVICWMKDDGSLSPISIVNKESMIDIFKDNGTLYLTAAQDGWSSISKLNADTKALDFGSTYDITTDILTNTLKKAQYFGTKVDSKYHDAYEDMSSKGSGESVSKDAGEYLDGDHVLHVSLSDTQKSLLELIEEYKKIEIEKQYDNEDNENNQAEKLANEAEKQVKLASVEPISDVEGKGYLITSFAHGLVYYDTKSKQAISLDEGTWYGTWRLGDKFVAVGFSNTGTAYESLDVAHARVMEFDLDSLYKSSLEGIIASEQEALNASGVEHSEDVKELLDKFEKQRASEDVEFVEPEGDQTPLDAWDENTPGEELEKIEAERQKEKEEESKAREEAGEWDPADEFRYGMKEKSGT